MRNKTPRLSTGTEVLLAGERMVITDWQWNRDGDSTILLRPVAAPLPETPQKEPQ